MRPWWALTENFDAQDERTSVSATINGAVDFQTTYAYDAVGRMTGTTQTGSGVSYKSVALDWTPDSQLKTVSRYASPTQPVESSDYNNHDALARLTDVVHSGPLVQRSYHWDYDAGDRITHAFASADGDNFYGNGGDEVTVYGRIFVPDGYG